jgi:hypothetical protein
MTRDATSTVERAVESEVVFRRVNDDIEVSASASGSSEATFLCECDDPSCHAGIELTLEEYHWIRSHPTYFVVAPGHEGELEGVGRVVRWSLGSSVVERLGYAGALAAAAYRN